MLDALLVQIKQWHQNYNRIKNGIIIRFVNSTILFYLFYHKTMTPRNRPQTERKSIFPADVIFPCQPATESRPGRKIDSDSDSGAEACAFHTFILSLSSFTMSRFRTSVVPVKLEERE